MGVRGVKIAKEMDYHRLMDWGLLATKAKSERTEQSCVRPITAHAWMIRESDDSVMNDRAQVR